MTRLKNSDIREISTRLTSYEEQLKAAAGKTLLGVACHAYDVSEADILKKITGFSIHVIPVTAGQGIITDFSRTVADILLFLGVDARVTDRTDASGLASAYESGADAIMLADDFRFVGINLKTRCVTDNSEVTGRVFAAALDLMAGGIKDKPALVMGCGPVGESAAVSLLERGAELGLYDTDIRAARTLKKRLLKGDPGSGVDVVESLAAGLSDYPHILEATPAAGTVPEDMLTDQHRIAAPGVPSGISESGCALLPGRLIHDKLELGVAAMAVGLVV
ncbi:MAG: 3-methylornithyl-N6-L-lysine dehydrogenase PylD [Desulfobacterales bacterium]|nr:3-methylornithyl-N6-L-lysine dehydrogenase PylD [Desulfobacterales bacterium]